jgi:hypothetical protein
LPKVSEVPVRGKKRQIAGARRFERRNPGDQYVVPADQATLNKVGDAAGRKLNCRHRRAG